MENYKKGKNVEEPLERDLIPISNLPKNFLWMQVRGGSKIRNLLTHALNEFPEVKHVVWTGFGSSVGKTITCAEIMKREYNNNLHQLTKLCYRQIEEFWDPLTPELDQLVVKRRLPMIHILLSTERINDDELGYQGPGSILTDTPTPTSNDSRNIQTKKVKKRSKNKDSSTSEKNKSTNTKC